MRALLILLLPRLLLTQPASEDPPVDVSFPPRPGVPSTLTLERVRGAARNGSPPHLYQLGLYQFYGAGVPQDRIAALTSFRAASDAGHGPAALALALLLDAGGEPAHALTHYARAGEAGELEALLRAGVLLFEGRAEPPPGSSLPRLEEAARLLRRAADAGYGPAFSPLGLMHEYGAAPGGRDFAAAERAYRRGCEGGGAGAARSVGEAPDAEACYNWGLMVAFGRAPTAPPRGDGFAAAAALFHRAVAARGGAGHAPSRLMLGKMAANGQGMPVDFDAALAHYAAARDSGDARVSGDAARAYETLEPLVAEAKQGLADTLEAMAEGMRQRPEL
jgi:TPR repeat protein